MQFYQRCLEDRLSIVNLTLPHCCTHFLCMTDCKYPASNDHTPAVIKDNDLCFLLLTSIGSGGDCQTFKKIVSHSQNKNIWNKLVGGCKLLFFYYSLFQCAIISNFLRLSKRIRLCRDFLLLPKIYSIARDITVLDVIFTFIGFW